MAVTSLDTLMAHKAINLAIDPSLNAIADLIGMSRRTVMRAGVRLERLSFFKKVRHGGKFHRNSYEPNWAMFREAEARWNSRRKWRQRKLAPPDVSPSERRTCHLDGDAHDHQTCSSNQLNETLASSGQSPLVRTIEQTGGKRSAMKVRGPTPLTRIVPRTLSVRSADAARAAAERRWSEDILREFAGRAAVYAAVVEFIDEPLRTAAIEAELCKPGGGLALIVERYRGIAGQALHQQQPSGEN
jgi:hypothetical protein